MKPIRDFFEEERNREQIISATQIDRFLKAHGHAHRAKGFDRGAPFFSNRTRIILMITTGLGLLTAGLIGFLSWNAGNPGGLASNEVEKGKGSELGRSVDPPTRGRNPNIYGKPGVKGDSPQPTNVAGTGEEEKKNEEKTLPETTPFIGGVRMLELTRQELGRLGIQSDEAVVRLYDSAEEKPMITKITMEGITLEGFIPERSDNPSASGGLQIARNGGLDPAVLQYKKATTEFSSIRPTFLTDDRGNRRMEWRDPSYDAKLSREVQAGIEDRERQIGRPLTSDERWNLFTTLQTEIANRRFSTGNLIPILVRTEYAYTDADRDSERSRPDCIFWYEPTPEFLAALPERLRTPLERELRLAAVLQSKPERESVEDFVNRQSPEVREGFASFSVEIVKGSTSVVAGEAVTGALSVASGAITASTVQPNPAAGHTDVRFTLASPRNVSLTLYDINGKLVQSLTGPTAMKFGENVETVDLEGVAAGIYLLTIQTDKGERVVRRMIVE